jgi:peptidyl-tRNA hydrolase, PTH1 family
MWLVAGLGNPGEEYAHTPHNLGFMVMDRLAEMHGIRITRPDSRALTGMGRIDSQEVMLAKPQTFMNLSGTSLKLLLEKHALAAGDLILVYDELALPWMTLRVKARGSSAGHNGAESVIRELGTGEFTRVRLGIHPGHPLRSGTEYLLSPFSRGRSKELEELVGEGAGAVVSIITEGVTKAMTKYNRRAQGLNEEA